MNVPATIFAIVVFTFFGLISLIYPRKMKRYLLKQYSQDNYSKYNPIAWWIKSPLYISSIQLIGVVCMAISLFLFLALLKHVLF